MILVSGFIYSARAFLSCTIRVQASSSALYGTLDMGLFRAHREVLQSLYKQYREKEAEFGGAWRCNFDVQI